MADFLLELLTEEIPARMQRAAADALRDRFVAACAARGLAAERVEAHATPRRLALLAWTLPATTEPTREERRGPRADAPQAAVAGFRRSAGIETLEPRDDPKGRFWYAVIERPGRAAADVLAEAAPEAAEGLPWPKSMRWGAASTVMDSPRWVRPLTGVVALLDTDIVPLSVLGVAAGRTTAGHRFLAAGPVEIERPQRYADQLAAAHVVLDAAARARIIAEGARAAAATAGLTLIEDESLAIENAGLTEWPVPLLGRFDPAFLDVPREVIQLTMRTNQRYFACADAKGALAPAFVCVANLAAPDGGAAIVEGNRRVLAARLADARFFWEQDMAAWAGAGDAWDYAKPRLERIVFHARLGSMADKAERVARLARWLAESGAVPGADPALAERAGRLAKADLTSAMVGEFPELQGVMGGYYARVAGEAEEVAAAIRDHYKPVGPSDTVPTEPVSVAVALADKLDTLASFFLVDERPTGSRDPFALRRAAIAAVQHVQHNGLRLSLVEALTRSAQRAEAYYLLPVFFQDREALRSTLNDVSAASEVLLFSSGPLWWELWLDGQLRHHVTPSEHTAQFGGELSCKADSHLTQTLLDFLVDRLKVQQRDAGTRHDLIDAVFALGGEDDLVRLLARVRALQAFVATTDGANLLAGYRRAANILAIEAKRDGVDRFDGGDAAPTPVDAALVGALGPAAEHAARAVAAEDFTAAMAALASLRAPIDAFFAAAMVNDPDPAVRRARLALLQRFRDAVHAVADFSRIEG